MILEIINAEVQLSEIRETINSSARNITLV